jgi:drug/metabolite transporter (DMT)-like permease
VKARLQHRHAGVAAIGVALFTLSWGSTIVKETGSPGSVVAFYRLTIASVVWHVILRARGMKLTRRHWRAVAPAGVLFGVNLVCFFTAVRLTRIANAEFTGTMAPALVVPFAAWRLKERVALRTIGLGVVALAGVSLILLTAAKGGSSRRGDLLAACAVVSWSTYLLVTKRTRRGIDTNVFMAVMSTVAAAVVAPVAVASGQLGAVSTKGWVLIALMVVTSGMLAHGLLAWSQQRVPVSTISIMQLAQPGMSTLWAFLVLDESVRGIQLVGMAVVLVAVGFIAREAARNAPPIVLPPDAAAAAT